MYNIYYILLKISNVYYILVKIYNICCIFFIDADNHFRGIFVVPYHNGRDASQSLTETYSYLM